MPIRISTAFHVDPQIFRRLSVYDRFLDVDSSLYIDPHLLSHSDVPEMQQAATALDQFWRDTVQIIQQIRIPGDRFYRAARARFTFHELPQSGLGYARGGTQGAAIGSALATALFETAQQIIAAGITDPTFFDLIGLLESGIGADRISDMTAAIILPHIGAFTQRTSREAQISTRPTIIQDTLLELPRNPRTGTSLLFLPMDVLRDLPVAFDWDDVDRVCAHNDALRARVNRLIGTNWRDAIRNNPKAKLREVLLENPGALTDLIEQYKRKPASPYDFTSDPKGEMVWDTAAAAAFAAQYPLAFRTLGPASDDNVVAIVKEICERFRTLVEDNGLAQLFWTDRRKLRPEKTAQLVFFGIADAYCRAGNLDLSPESNSGRGPVDFKISSGYQKRVLVEVKWSNNRKLLQGFTAQLPTYARAERTEHLIYLVIKVSDTTTALQELERLHSSRIRAGKKAPDIITIDGRIRPSASRA